MNDFASRVGTLVAAHADFHPEILKFADERFHARLTLCNLWPVREQQDTSIWMSERRRAGSLRGFDSLVASDAPPQLSTGLKLVLFFIQYRARAVSADFEGVVNRHAQRRHKAICLRGHADNRKEFPILILGHAFGAGACRM